MSIAGSRSSNFEDRQVASTSSTSIPVSISTSTTTITVTARVPPTTETETATTTATIYVTPTTTAIVYVTITPSQSPRTITTTIASIITSTKLETSFITSPGICQKSQSRWIGTTTITSTIPTPAAASAGSQPPLPDHSSTSQGTITGLAVALIAVIILTFLAWLFWWRKGKAKKNSPSTRRSESFSAFVPKGDGSWNSQHATHSSGLGSYTSKPYNLPMPKSVVYSGFGSHFGVGRDSSSGVTYPPDSQTQTLNVDGNEEFFPPSLSQLECAGEIGMAL